MSPDFDNPVLNEMAVTSFRAPLSHEYYRNEGMEEKSPRKRRIFVQTETGNVLGIELESSDNAHTVKKRLQLALNFPVAGSLLLYGDIVLKNDLSTVRNDSPLLLTRSYLHRSSSTPCFSHIGMDLHQGDQSGPVEILGCSSDLSRGKQLVKEIVKAIEHGVDPIPVHSGLGGAYYFRSCTGENVAIVKPTDEEPFAPNNPKGFVGKALGQPGLKRSVRVGETGFREVAAYLLDYDHFANVPLTIIVKITHPIFNVNDEVAANRHPNTIQVSKIASLQQFIPHDFDASDHGTSSFPVAAVHRIGILDVRVMNTDRHAGNLLVRKFDVVGRFDQVKLIPIDHGLCLPESLEDPYFEWIHWPQASIPFSEDELEYIARLDPFRDAEMLRIELPMIRESCLRVLVLCTIFLKEAAVCGLCLGEIGEMMSREFHGHDEEPSELEMVCLQARMLLETSHASCLEAKFGIEEDVQFDMDREPLSGLNQIIGNKLANKLPVNVGFRISDGQNPLSVLTGSVEVKDGKTGECDGWEEHMKMEKRAGILQRLVPAASKFSTSLKNTKLGEKSWQHLARTTLNGTHTSSTSSGNRSVNEHLPANTYFVKLADIDEDEWMMFLENFQKLLRRALLDRKYYKNSGSRQRQRLGTSCQF